MKRLFAPVLLLLSAAACTPRERTVVILSTNDMHAHIENFGRLASAVRQCRDTFPDAILVDAGDRWTGNVYCDRAAEPRRPIIDLMNRLGYDVATFGNHEFDPGQELLVQRTSEAGFEVACANLRSGTASFPQPAPYVVVERGGLKIGFVGVVTNYDNNNHPAGHDANFVGLSFTDAIDTAAGLQSLGAECDVLAAVTHIGTEKDRLLAEKAPGYDLIIGGHSHDETDETVNGVLLTQTGKNLRNVGVTEIRLRGDEVIDIGFRLVPLSGYEPDPEFQERIDAYYDAPELCRPVTAIDGTLRKTGLIRTFVAALKQYGKADIGLYHMGGVRLDSLVGAVTEADIYNLDPFGSRVVTVEMTPAQLERMIMAKFNDTINTGESHYLDIHATTPYVIHTDASFDATGVTFPELKDGRKYRVAMGDYIYKNYKQLEGENPQDPELLVTEALKRYFSERNPVKPVNETLQKIE